MMDTTKAFIMCMAAFKQMKSFELGNLCFEKLIIKYSDPSISNTAHGTMEMWSYVADGLV